MNAHHPCGTIAVNARINLAATIKMMDYGITILREDAKNIGSHEPRDPELIAKVNDDLETFLNIRERLSESREILSARNIFVHVGDYHSKPGDPGLLKAVEADTIKPLSSRQ